MIFEPIELRKLTTMRIGGVVSRFLLCKNIHDIEKIIIRENEYKVLGNGSNLLVSDNISNVPVMKLGAEFKFIRTVNEQYLDVGGAILVRELLHYCIVNHVGGLSFLAGIPATIGGCIFMNAGTSGISLGDIVSEVEVVTSKGAMIIKAEDINFGYRETSLDDCVVVRARLRVTIGVDIKQSVELALKNKISAQEMVLPSCGCVFKNPKTQSAGLLIDRCGLKYMRKNEAQISGKHGNFIVNLGKASYNDVDYLINFVRDDVYSKFGILLKEEIIRWI